MLPTLILLILTKGSRHSHSHTICRCCTCLLLLKECSLHLLIRDGITLLYEEGRAEAAKFLRKSAEECGIRKFLLKGFQCELSFVKRAKTLKSIVHISNEHRDRLI